MCVTGQRRTGPLTAEAAIHTTVAQLQVAACRCCCCLLFGCFVPQARKREDPRLKDIKAVVKPTASADSSVCPDPEPVPGFQPRSTWMAGQRAPSASPPPSAMGAQVRAPRSQLAHLSQHLHNYVVLLTNLVFKLC